MERPKPTKQIILELCGYDKDLILHMYFGLNEIPLDQFYPHLNMDELLLFESASWINRNSNNFAFRNLVKAADVYDIFRNAFSSRIYTGRYSYDSPFQWLYSKRNISIDLSKKYEQLNPFKGKNLEERLGKVNPEDVDALRAALNQDTRRYVTSLTLDDERLNDVNVEGDEIIEIIASDERGLRTKKKIGSFASRIVNILSNYPRNVIQLDHVTRDLSENQIYLNI